MAVSTAVPASSKAAVLGIKTEYRNLAVGALFGLPQRCGLIGQGATASSYATTKAQVFSANEVGSTYGFGSPLHLAALQLLPVSGDGIGSIPLTVYPLEDDGGATTAAGDITPTPGSIVEASYYVVVNNIRSAAFTVEVGDAVADIVDKMVTAINAESTMPVIAAATNPSVTAALAQVGDVWETMFVNCLDIADTTTLDEYAAFGEGRWGALTHKPCMFFTGNTEATLATAITVPDARGTDRTNGQLVSPGSNDLPFVVAAREAARMLVVANENPPVAYGGQRATGLVPGTDGSQWTYAQRDTAVKSGSSTIKVVDGVVTLEDIVTFYHPAGDLLPAYSYAVDIVKLQNIIFNTDIIFSDPGWKSAPLIPDDQPTTNSAARKPKDAKAAIASLIDSLALAAIISDPETAKGTIVAEINGSNPKRLDVTFTVQLSGNTKIISVDLFFGFYFGTAQAA
jgi:phage tail sheath gpL-like